MVHAVVPGSLIAERRLLGLDKKDEEWEGVLHMNLPGSREHQRIEGRLYAALLPVADATGVEIGVEEGLFDPAVTTYESFRVPDIVVFDPAVGSERGLEGRASLVIEVRSPGDDSFAKIAFYNRMGAAEMLIVDRDTKLIRRWAAGPDGLVEVTADATGRHRLAALPVTVWHEDGRLHVETPEGTTLI